MAAPRLSIESRLRYRAHTKAVALPDGSYWQIEPVRGLGAVIRVWEHVEHLPPDERAPDAVVTMDAETLKAVAYALLAAAAGGITPKLPMARYAVPPAPLPLKSTACRDDLKVWEALRHAFRPGEQVNTFTLTQRMDAMAVPPAIKERLFGRSISPPQRYLRLRNFLRLVVARGAVIATGNGMRGERWLYALADVHGTFAWNGGAARAGPGQTPETPKTAKTPGNPGKPRFRN